MPDINKPMDVPELSLKPPIDGKVRLSADMQQTLTLLTAYGVNSRKLLKASESGVLNTASARIKDIAHYKRDGATDPKIGEAISCTECLIMAHPTNTGRIWVRPYTIAETTNAWPLDAGEVVGFTLDNLSQLNMLIDTDLDSLIVAYTR